MDIEAQGNFLVGKHINVPGGWCTLTPGEIGMIDVLLAPLQTLPMYILTMKW